MFTSFAGPKAKRFLKKCEKELYQRLRNKIRELEKNPFPPEVESIKGTKGRKSFRVRVGSHRIKYVVYYDKKEILIFDIDKRERVYN